MSKPTPLITTSEITQTTPRARRGAAAVIAQYIQDLTHPSESDLRAAVA
jgi:hypothetical protein